MKHLLTYFILTLLATTTLYALRPPNNMGEYFNRDTRIRSLQNNNSGWMLGEDSDYTTPVSLNTDAACYVSIDENDVSYSADASINGSGPNANCGGYYMVDAWVVNQNPDLHHSEQETLEYLKTQGATHVMLTKLDPNNTILRKKLSKAFVPVYIDLQFASIYIWEIHYSPDIKPNPKYLTMEPK